MTSKGLEADIILYREIKCKKRNILMQLFICIFNVIWLESGNICKSYDHTCLFHYTNTCQVPLEMFEQLALGLHVQTVSLRPGI